MWKYLHEIYGESILFMQIFPWEATINFLINVRLLLLRSPSQHQFIITIWARLVCSPPPSSSTHNGANLRTTARPSAAARALILVCISKVYNQIMDHFIRIRITHRWLYSCVWGARRVPQTGPECVSLNIKWISAEIQGMNVIHFISQRTHQQWW